MEGGAGCGGWKMHVDGPSITQMESQGQDRSQQNRSLVKSADEILYFLFLFMLVKYYMIVLVDKILGMGRVGL